MINVLDALVEFGEDDFSAEMTFRGVSAMSGSGALLDRCAGKLRTFSGTHRPSRW